jgi:hypothetical protein
LIRAVFPKAKWMQDKYNLKGGYQLPYFYIKRLRDLVANKMPT